jgi:hypothetical protein
MHRFGTVGGRRCVGHRRDDVHFNEGHPVGVVYIGVGVFVTAQPGTTVNLTPVGVPASNYSSSVTSRVVGHH